MHYSGMLYLFYFNYITMLDNINIQNASLKRAPVTHKKLRSWIESALPKEFKTASITLRLVTEDEMIHLNQTYRKINKTTNVLSFPSDLPQEIQAEHPFLGDIVICPAVLKSEILFLKISLTAHWAHIVIHGVLHLLGYDHILIKDEQKMKPLEIKLLEQLGFANPY